MKDTGFIWKAQKGTEKLLSLRLKSKEKINESLDCIILLIHPSITTTWIFFCNKYLNIFGLWLISTILIVLIINKFYTIMLLHRWSHLNLIFWKVDIILI